MNNPELDTVLELDTPAPGPAAPHGTSNLIASLLKVTGILVLIVGTIAGFLNRNWAVGVPIMISSAISCLLFLGFAEIIRLLEKIAQNMAK